MADRHLQRDEWDDHIQRNDECSDVVADLEWEVFDARQSIKTLLHAEGKSDRYLIAHYRLRLLQARQALAALYTIQFHAAQLEDERDDARSGHPRPHPDAKRNRSTQAQS